jgi:hypothetical protein
MANETGNWVENSRLGGMGGIRITDANNAPPGSMKRTGQDLTLVSVTLVSAYKPLKQNCEGVLKLCF